jgi:hypothetical protein
MTAEFPQSQTDILQGMFVCNCNKETTKDRHHTREVERRRMWKGLHLQKRRISSYTLLMDIPVG